MPPKKNTYGDELIVSPKARVAFPNLDKPDTGRQYSDDKYKATFLFDKDSTDMSKLESAALAVAKKHFGPKIKLSDMTYLPFRDGDEMEKNYDGFSNAWVIQAKSQNPVTCIDRDEQNIDPREVYGGCYARAAFVPCAYQMGKNKGVTFLLQFIQKLDEGPRFGGFGSVDPSDVFGEWSDDDEDAVDEEEVEEEEESEEEEEEDEEELAAAEEEKKKAAKAKKSKAKSKEAKSGKKGSIASTADSPSKVLDMLSS